MDHLFNFSPQLAETIGWTIIHSIWQGFAVMALLWLVLKTISKKRANLRFNCSLFSLLVLILWPVSQFIWTWVHLSEVSTGKVLLPVEFIPFVITNIELESQGFTAQVLAYCQMLAPYLSAVYLIGLLLYALRLSAGLTGVFILRRKGLIPFPDWVSLEVDRLAKQLEIKRKVQIFESTLAKSPLTLGHFKPLILMPIGLVSQLSTSQVEAILAHELAHIRRNDYLLNTIISFMEVFFFYHPAFWWIKKQIHLEREMDCDDLAIQTGTSLLEYMKALTAVKEYQLQPHALTLSFSGSNNNHLMSRFKRLLLPKEKKSIMKGKLIVVLSLFGILLLTGWKSIPEEIKEIPQSIKENILGEEEILEIPLLAENKETEETASNENLSYSFNLDHEERPKKKRKKRKEENLAKSIESLVVDVGSFLVEDVALGLTDLGLNITEEVLEEIVHVFDTVPPRSTEEFEAEMDRLGAEMEEIGEKIESKMELMEDELELMAEELAEEAERIAEEFSKDVNLERKIEAKSKKVERMAEELALKAEKIAIEVEEKLVTKLELKAKELEKIAKEFESHMEERVEKLNVELTADLRKDGYFKKGEKINSINVQKNGNIQINGKTIKKEHTEKYKAIIEKYFSTGDNSSFSIKI